MLEWQPIETAPKDGTDVLVCADTGWMFVAYWDKKQWTSNACCDNWTALDDDEIVGWMPLPKPPAP